MNLSDLPLHHAVLLTHSDRKSATENLWNELQHTSRAHRLFDRTVLDIDTAREIINWSRSSYEGARIGLISFHTAGIPAQNALLKVLEEPRGDMRFIIITSNKSALIETVLSRLQYHTQENNTQALDRDAFATAFLVTPHTQRMKLPYVTELLARIDEEGRKDREGVRLFILSLLPILKKDKDGKNYIVTTLETASFAGDPSSSGKGLLEYLSLLLPQVKD